MTSGMLGINSFRAFSALNFNVSVPWGVAPGFCISRLWRFSVVTAAAQRINMLCNHLCEFLPQLLYCALRDF
jgi:hypothetical protein